MDAADSVHLRVQEFVIGFCAIVLATFTTGIDSKSFSVSHLTHD